MILARYVFWVAVVGSLALVGAQAQDFSAKVSAGLNYLEQQAIKNVDYASNLLQVLKGGSLEEAKIAYIKARPYYEQVEVLANSFPNLDASIDARAYAFPNGEARAHVDGETLRNPGQHFQGYHKIEALLFRDSTLKGTVPEAERLLEHSEQLVDIFQGNRTQFSAAKSFEGMIALATEVAAKKMSSEEETYSDMSVLIFANNFIGIESQITPFLRAIAKADKFLAARLEAALEVANAAAGKFVWVNSNGDTQYVKYSGVAVQDRKAIQFAAYNLAANLRLAAKALGIEMPEEESEDECVPSVDAANFPGNGTNIQAGLAYFLALMPYQKSQIKALKMAIVDNNLEAAKTAYKESRPIYEQIEVLAAAFVGIDTRVDARPYAFGVGEFDPDFQFNFHMLERQIYRDGYLGPQALAGAEGLGQLMDELEEALGEESRYNGEVNWEGILGLATEVVAKKISSEEELWSDLSLLIFYSNYKGIYSQVEPFLEAVDDEYAEELRSAISDVIDCMPITVADDIFEVSAKHVTQAFVDSLSKADYGRYSLTDMDTRQCIVSAGYKVRDVLIEIADDLKLLSDCSDFHRTNVHMYEKIADE